MCYKNEITHVNNTEVLYEQTRDSIDDWHQLT